MPSFPSCSVEFFVAGTLLTGKIDRAKSVTNTSKECAWGTPQKNRHPWPGATGRASSEPDNDGPGSLRTALYAMRVARDSSKALRLAQCPGSSDIQVRRAYRGAWH